MKESNNCDTNCHPRQDSPILTSNESCPRATRAKSTFAFADCISKITISNANAKVVGWLMQHDK